MTRSCCPACRLRFSRATASSIRSCPFCAGPIAEVSAAEAIGMRLVAIEPLLHDEPAAIARTIAFLPPSAPSSPSHRLQP
jgi:hypothetical protein